METKPPVRATEDASGRAGVTTWGATRPDAPVPNERGATVWFTCSLAGEPELVTPLTGSIATIGASEVTVCVIGPTAGKTGRTVGATDFPTDWAAGATDLLTGWLAGAMFRVTVCVTAAIVFAA